MQTSIDNQIIESYLIKVSSRLKCQKLKYCSYRYPAAIVELRAKSTDEKHKEEGNVQTTKVS